MYLILLNSLGVLHWAGWPFGPLFSLDLVPYRNKGSTHSILKQFFSVEPSNKANAVCVQLVRPWNSSQGGQDYFFSHKMERIIDHPLLLELPYLSIKPKTQSQQGKKWCPVRGPQKPYPIGGGIPTYPILGIISSSRRLHVSGSKQTWIRILTMNARLFMNFLLLNVAFATQIFLISTMWDNSHLFLVTCHRKFHVFHKSDFRWSSD